MMAGGDNTLSVFFSYNTVLLLTLPVFYFFYFELERIVQRSLKRKNL